MGTHFLGGLNMRPVAVPNATTYTVLATNSGKIHAVPDVSADITITLPTVENGLTFTFWYVGAAADAEAWIIDTAATTELFKGGVTQLDPLEATLTEVVPVYADFSNDDKLTIDLPEVGTNVTFTSDGVSWLTTGFVVSDTVPVFA